MCASRPRPRIINDMTPGEKATLMLCELLRIRIFHESKRRKSLNLCGGCGGKEIERCHMQK